MTFLIYLAVGALGGTIAGLLGVGGGIVIVPALITVFTYLDFPAAVLTHMAVATSLAAIVPTSISSIRAHHKRGAIDWLILRRLLFGIVIGAILGALVADHLAGEWLQALFGLFAILVSAQVGLGLNPSTTRQLPGSKSLAVAGGVIGFCSSLFGIGGGSMTIPFLTWCNVPMTRTVATSSACGLPIATAGVLGFVLAGWNEQLPVGSVGYVYGPAFLGIILASVIFAQLGAWLAHTLPSVQLKRLFGIFLLIVGLKFLVAVV